MHDIDDPYSDPDNLLFRKKTCPCCRAVIQSRPIPLFLVKSITNAYNHAKAIPGTVRHPSPVPEADPWAGIFREAAPDDDDEWSGDEEDEDEGSLEDEDEEYDDPWPYDGYGSDPDEERYEGLYVRPHWAPPNVYIHPEDYQFEAGRPNESELALLRRGASFPMIELFRMEYTHENGIEAMLDDDNIVFLGWNISLRPGDETGESYMQWVASDIFERPERWQLSIRPETGNWTAWRLIPAEEDEEYEYSDSYSEMWEE